MNIRVKLLAVVALLALLSSPVRAGDIYIVVFYGAGPVADAEVMIDGDILGRTNEQGIFDYFLNDGSYEIQIGNADPVLASFNLEVVGDENVDIRIDASGSGEPAIAIDSYETGDTAGPTGMIAGIVEDGNGQPLSRARVEVKGMNIVTFTDADGQFSMEVPRGIQIVGAEHEEGKTDDREIRVVAGTGVELNMTVWPDAFAFDASALSEGIAIEETVVLGNVYNLNPIDAVSIEREAITIVDALDLAQIARFGDSDVASAVRRIAGVAVKDGQFALIRGLEGRYLSNLINGANVPSTDPLRRDLQLDLFPADILGGIQVFKGYTADQPGESTAGTLRIDTRDLPDEPVFKLSVSAGFRDGVTGETVLDYEGSETDFLGFDDGFRALPQGFDIQGLADAQASGNPVDLTTLEQIELAQSFTNVFNTSTDTATLPFGLSGAVGNSYDFETGTFGFYAASSFGNDTRLRQDEQIIDVDDIEDVNRVETDVDFNAYVALGWETDRLDLVSNTTFIRQTTDRVSNSLTVDTDDANREFDETILEFTEREFFSQQFFGTHQFFDGEHQLEWTFGLSESSRFQPDRRAFTFDNRPNIDSNEGLLVSNEVERRWSTLDDDGVFLSADYNFAIQFSDAVFTDFKVGGLLNAIDRDVDLVRIVFESGNSAELLGDLLGVPFFTELDPETQFQGNVLGIIDGDNPAITVDFRTESTGSYDAEADTRAAFIHSETTVGDFWKVSAGVRSERFIQSLVYPNDPGATAETDELNSSELLPALGVTYTPSDSWQFRAAFSSTVSYPGLTEFAESLTFDPDTDQPIFGNPDLQVSTIDNLDLRAEYYFGANSSISAALFFKQIDNPIERAVGDGSGIFSDALTFENSETASVQGIEIDANVTIFDGTDWDGFIGGNLAFTDSSVTLGSNSTRLEADPNRQLQGLSPILANLQFGVDHIATGLKGTLLLNFFDDRIERLQRSSVLGPIFEQGRVELDMNFEWETNFGSTLSLQLGNVLDSEIQFVGENVTNGAVFFDQSYTRGRTVSLGFSHEF